MIRFSDELETALHRAQDMAAEQGHSLMTVEHLLLSLLDDPECTSVLRACQVNLDELRLDLERHINQHLSSKKNDGDLIPTLSFQRVLERSILHVQSSGKSMVQGPHMLVAIIEEPESHAAFFLHKQHVSRLDIIRYLSHRLVKTGNKSQILGTSVVFEKNKSRDETTGGNNQSSWDGPQTDSTNSSSTNPEAWEHYCTNLNEAARQGKLSPIIGRNKELNRLFHVLCRKQKNNPLLVGDPGVGKTALIEGLAYKIVHKEVPQPLQHFVIYALDLGLLLAGTRYRGDFEERLQSVLDHLVTLSNAILFVDEIHTLIGAGATTGTMDASNLMKPFLTRGNLRCIGSTTFKDYKTSFEKDHGFARRFQKITIEEPGRDETLAILAGMKQHFEAHHQVHYAPEALEAMVDLTARFLHDRKQPDKSIDAMDEAGAFARLNIKAHSKKKQQSDKKKTIGRQDIESVVAEMAQIPSQQIHQTERYQLLNLESILSKVIYGQDQAIQTLSKALILARSGLRETQKPVGCFLFAGPTGVGKTELARQLALQLGLHFQRFDMSEYMEKHSVSKLIGTPPGYVGFDQGGALTDAVDQHPYAVVLLDEIEKAHPDIYNLLLQVMDYGRLTDHHGKVVDFRHVILIMTSNAGADIRHRHPLGFEQIPQAGDEAVAIEKTFSPEFRNRLDAVIYFNNLGLHEMERIVEKFIDDMNAQLASKNMRVTLKPSAKQWLVKHGFDSLFGARPLSRLMDQEIRWPIAKQWLETNDLGPKKPDFTHIVFEARNNKLSMTQDNQRQRNRGDK